MLLCASLLLPTPLLECTHTSYKLCHRPVLFFLGAEMQTDVGCLCLAIDVFATALCYLGHKLESVTCWLLRFQLFLLYLICFLFLQSVGLSTLFYVLEQSVISIEHFVLLT